mmetsp:Transcript_69268/g.129343  ORF Transcript_69268/g.129343 Transcript_69268/m.129343 type:complete len:420 (+) Transcript_69268:99-1358(+)
MGNFLNQPVELIRVQRGGCAAFHYAAAEMQGWRSGHEDCHAAACDGPRGSFWVLDGHCGAGAANYTAPRLAQELMTSLKNSGFTALLNKEIVEVFESLDQRFKDEVRNNPKEDSGSTVVGVVASKNLDGEYEAKLVNCGDSRAVLIRPPSEAEAEAEAQSSLEITLPPAMVEAGNMPVAGWPVVVESTDHKPNHPVEKARIEAAGGYVLACEDPPRLDGNLAVSRSVGDFEYKQNEALTAAQQKVSCIPDIYNVTGLKPGSICLLACDGIWDVMSTKEAANFVRGRLVDDSAKDLGDIAAELLKECLSKGSRDNMTAMLIHFQDGTDVAERFPSDEMQNGDKLLDIVDDEVKTHYRKFLERDPVFPQESRSCKVCGRWFANPSKCPCGTVTYCSKPCQKKDFKEHKPVCSAVVKQSEAD